MRTIKLTDEDSRFVEDVLRSAPFRDATDRNRARWIASELAKVNRRWKVEYDDGCSLRSQSYRTIFGARAAMWWNQRVSPEEGAGQLIDTDHVEVKRESQPDGLGW